MLDDFLNVPLLEDGDTEDLGDHINGAFTAFQIAGNLSFRNQGDWDNAKNYKLNDAVWHSGQYWHTLAANINSEPAAGNANWRALAASATDANQNANLVKAGPASGSAAAPTYRALVAADIPALNALAPPTSDLSVNGQKIINLAPPVSSNDAARKIDVDAARNGLSIKDPVRVATTANITLSGTQTIDGVAVIAGDRVLVKNQTTAAENGIYVVASSAWSRAGDADISAEVVGGMACWVNEGTANGTNRYVLTTLDPITLGTTGLTFVQDAASGGVSTVNTLSGSVTLDDSNVNAQDPTDSATVKTLRTILSNLYTAILARAKWAGSAVTSDFLKANSSGELVAATMTTGKLLGRSSASTGAIEELTVGSGLTLSGGTLTASGGGGGGGSGNGVSIVAAASLTSPYALTSGDMAANTLIFTGTRSTALEIYSTVAGSWVVENQTGQIIRALPATGSAKKAPIQPDEARQFSTDLTDIYLSEALLKYGIPTANLALYLQNANGISSGTWLDQSGNGNNATLANGAAPITSGGLNGVDFDGTNDQATIASNFGLTATPACTLFVRAAFTSSQKGGLLHVGGNNANGYSLSVGYSNNVTSTGNDLIVHLPGVTTYYGGTIGTGVHSVAVVFNGSTARTFVDGVFMNSVSIGTPITPSNSTTLGGYTEGAQALYFDGAVFDAAVYSAALSDAAVLQLHNNL